MEEDDQRHPLTPAQIHQLMSVIAGMDSVKEAGAGKKKNILFTSFFNIPLLQRTKTNSMEMVLND